MTEAKRPIGRPRRYAKFEEFEASLPAKMTKRPQYCDGIGIFKGASGSTVWVKLRLPRGGTYNGRSIPKGGSLEHKLGKRSSWDWQQLVEERDRLQGIADRGEALEAEDIQTFGTYALEWLERKKPTLRGYGVTKGHIISALNPLFGKRSLDTITVAELNKWISTQSKSLKPASVKRQLATFNAIMNDAVRSGIIERNPSERADRIKGADEARQRTVTGDEWKLILDTIEKIERAQHDRKQLIPQQIRGWLRHYIVWAYNSGMRRTEILNLTWDHVRQLEEGLTVIEVEKTKSGKPRAITCTGEMLNILKALTKLERSEGDKRLFPVSVTTLKRALTNLWKESGLEDVRLHDLRRTHATMLMQRNVDPRTIAGRLGHSGTNMLAKHYAVYLNDLDAAQAFENPIEGKASA